VGGGPAGLFLALLLRRSGDHEVDVFERSPAGSAYGFGVVFSRLTLARLGPVAPDVVEALLERGARWDDVEVRRGGSAVRSSGQGFAAVARKDMIAALASLAADAGARLHFATTPDVRELLADHDVVVAAEGAGSSTRRALAGRLGEHVEPGGSRYAWFGVDRAFDAMTFLFADGPHGPVSAHVYPYGDGMSTFLVEVSEATWRAGGFADGAGQPPGWNDDEALAYCSKIFAADLDGARLLAHGSRWLPFHELRTSRWSDGRLVLVGDAAHTAHFSVGSGTALALEDAAELARCLTGESTVDAALAAFEANRRPAVDSVQQAARVSRRMWAEPGEHRDLDVGLLLLRLLTRTGQTTMDVVLHADPELPARVGRPLTGRPADVPVLGRPGDPALTRLDDVPTDAGPPVLVELPDRPADELAAALRRARDAAPDRRLGIALRVERDETARAAAGAAAELAKEAGLDLVAVLPAPGNRGAVRVAQMVACEQLTLQARPGVEVAYACEPGELPFGWTHVQAGRADLLWEVS
jgi:anthraniloyl-CoA monooxygenase